MDTSEPQICACGCGLPLNRPHYRPGHSGRRRGYVVEDRGYETPCWVGEGGKTRSGYVKRHRSVNGRDFDVFAHRESYEKAKGPIPPGFQIDHLCRVRACMNPDHLEAVTPRENVLRQPHVRLEPADIVYIRSLRRGERSAIDLAAQFDVTPNTIRQVRRKRNEAYGRWDSAG